ncbi:hypothetical protein PMAYCL1PPCAC_10435 [Pristionchus mayeri]|uniref:BPTI/Kunitz inhibitor domain-containing protein n=1 Tax=Pristionchus mayeri TaxID=1317129 RepID=A0AAN4ZMC2_9BILA|nr:hypothetical protein PMAYCL1PPCAC_10435 [Pristionchus mayeri]
MFSLFFLFFIVASVQAGEECKIGTKTIMYYFDSSRMECFPIETVGCPHDRYSTLRDCQATIPTDFNMCAANSPVVKRPNGKTHCYHEGRPEYEANKCPTGSICKMGFAVGMCCDKKIEDEYNEEKKARCPQGKKVIQTTDAYHREPFFGKECSHNFCPSNTVCQEGKYMAWCCK